MPLFNWRGKPKPAATPNPQPPVASGARPDPRNSRGPSAGKGGEKGGGRASSSSSTPPRGANPGWQRSSGSSPAHPGVGAASPGGPGGNPEEIQRLINTVRDDYFGPLRQMISNNIAGANDMDQMVNAFLEPACQVVQELQRRGQLLEDRYVADLGTEIANVSEEMEELRAEVERWKRGEELLHVDTSAASIHRRSINPDQSDGDEDDYSEEDDEDEEEEDSEEDHEEDDLSPEPAIHSEARRISVELEMERRAEEEARLRAEEQRRVQLEAELAVKRKTEQEAEERAAAEEARKREEEDHARQRAEAEARKRADEELRQQLEAAEARRRAQEEEEARHRTEVAAQEAEELRQREAELRRSEEHQAAARQHDREKEELEHRTRRHSECSPSVSRQLVPAASVSTDNSGLVDETSRAPRESQRGCGTLAVGRGDVENDVTRQPSATRNESSKTILPSAEEDESNSRKRQPESRRRSMNDTIYEKQQMNEQSSEDCSKRRGGEDDTRQRQVEWNPFDSIHFSETKDQKRKPKDESKRHLREDPTASAPLPSLTRQGSDVSSGKVEVVRSNVSDAPWKRHADEDEDDDQFRPGDDWNSRWGADDLARSVSDKFKAKKKGKGEPKQKAEDRALESMQFTNEWPEVWPAQQSSHDRGQGQAEQDWCSWELPKSSHHPPPPPPTRTMSSSEVPGAPTGTLVNDQPPTLSKAAGPPIATLVSSRPPAAPAFTNTSASNRFPSAPATTAAPLSAEHSRRKPRAVRLRIHRPFAEVEHDIDAFTKQFIEATAQATGIAPHRIRVKSVREERVKT